MWIILTILLAITCMWLIKVNKDLANRNEYLIKLAEFNRRSGELILEPLSVEQIEELKKIWKDEYEEEKHLKKHSDDDKEDNE